MRDDRNYFQEYEYRYAYPPDTRSRRKKLWHRLTFRTTRYRIWYWREYGVWL